MATYGLSDATTLSKVTTDYQNRTGQNLPLFYVELELAGRQEATTLHAEPLDQPWVERAVLWKGAAATRTFYVSWSAWNQSAEKTHRQQVRQLLIAWSLSQNVSEREGEQKKILNFLSESKKPEAIDLLTAWKTLQAGEAPLSYYLPKVKWNGVENTYHQWITSFLSGDLGVSSQDYEPVSTKIAQAALVSFSIASLGLLAGLLLTYYIGIYFTLHPKATITRVSHLFLYFLDSIPAFLIALALYGFWLIWAGLSSSYLFDENYGQASLFQLWSQPSILLGAVCVVLLILPFLSLQFYRSLQDQNGQLYLRTALAKGLAPRKALQTHALPNALVPTLTIVSEVIIGLMSGVLVIEITFSLPGLGSLLTRSILSADFPVLIGLTLFFLIFRVIVIWMKELIIAFIDPRLSRA
ncbi:ABC transporter permease [Rufibacter soli]